MNHKFAREGFEQQLIQQQEEKPNSLLLGKRIPKDFFITQGTGESDLTIHAGSYHLALREAGIERHNIMVYSSTLPSIATEIKKPKSQDQGAVMETIMAVSNAKTGERASAGIVFGWLHHKKTNEKYGGVVCEYNGNDSEGDVKKMLQGNIMELYENGYSEDYVLKDPKFIIKSFIPKKKFGTALVALCFTNYVYPVIKQ